jgi:putative nucleotidyltransferase with HDIG domain
VSHRHLVRAALVLGGCSAALAVALNTLRGTPQDDIWRLVLWSGGTGAAAVGVATVLVMLLERPFGVSTHLGLLELAAPGEELMLRLQKEAPGTYTHSLMVSQMSEAAAKAVGGDPLLCRVGGLYHDIGKLRRPNCFVENQGGANIHEHLTPQMSAVLIIAHVQDGLDLGRAQRLPQPVLDIIAQHHGSTLLAFFLHRARQLEKNSDAPPLDEAIFRYPGPRPQSKEAAIVLLADTVEASARALALQSFGELQDHIRNMTSQRLQDGELADCDLTMRDLETVQHSFAQVLRGVLHKRIEYPKAAEKTGPARGREWPWAVRNLATERRRLQGARENTISALNAHLNRGEKSAEAPKRRRRADDFATTPVTLHENRTSTNLAPKGDEITNGHSSESNGHAPAGGTARENAGDARRRTD